MQVSPFLLLLQLACAVVTVTCVYAIPPTSANEDSRSQVVIDVPRPFINEKNNGTTWLHRDDLDSKEVEKDDDVRYTGLRDGRVIDTDFELPMDYQFRVTEPTLCDPTVKQYSGYLDISNTKHIFFWFFESRTAPENAPLILWLSGGPGCSGTYGLLFELGPCKLFDNTTNAKFNPHSWNTNAHVLFIDQPTNTGFSYGDKTSNSGDAARDVYVFLQLFFRRYPEYAIVPLHIAAESYGGTFAPNIASVVVRENRKIRRGRWLDYEFEGELEGSFEGNLEVESNDPLGGSTAPISHTKININLASIVMGNGLTNPLVQINSTAEFVCDGAYNIFDPEGDECRTLRDVRIPRCGEMAATCYASLLEEACAEAQKYCHEEVWGVFLKTTLNPYDARLECDRAEDEDGPECYRQIKWVEDWLNVAEHQRALGVDTITATMHLNRRVAACDLDVFDEFMKHGDAMYPTHRLLGEVVDEGIRLLVYVGDTDMMCNYIGQERWMNQLDTKFKEEFQRAEYQPWLMERTGKVVGEVRSAGNLTFVKVHEAGHMAPFDQPEATLELINRWIANLPLVVKFP